MIREPKIEGTDVDLTVPLDKAAFIVSDKDCFGNMWDMSSKECPQCANPVLYPSTASS